MKKEYLSKKVIGTREFGSVVEVTDPCYDKDVWCRLNGIEIQSGSYECVIWKDTYAVGVIGIYRNGVVPEQRTMREIGEIGVDAGLAGFFENKPDYNDAEWSEFCDNIREGNAWMIDCGFFSSSGHGDGCYGVYAHKTKGVIDALEIRFL